MNIKIYTILIFALSILIQIIPNLSAAEFRLTGMSSYEDEIETDNKQPPGSDNKKENPYNYDPNNPYGDDYDPNNPYGDDYDPNDPYGENNKQEDPGNDNIKDYKSMDL